MMNRTEILQTLLRFQQRKKQDYRILRIGIFGSAARGELNEQSDVDVVVEMAHPDLFALVRIKQDLDALLHHPVDVIRYRKNMNTFLKARIDQEAVYI